MVTNAVEAAGPSLGKDITREMVEAALADLLASPHFKGSQRSRQFLKYVVTCTLEGRSDNLRERVLGMDLFSRPTSYDPSEDSVVRVAASDVRKRLAQYYAQECHRTALRIDLPLGSYVPEFKVAPGPPIPVAAPVQTPGPAVRPKLWMAAALLAIFAAAAVVALHRSSDPVQQFWAPVLSSDKPVLMTLGNSAVYTLSGRVYNEHLKTQPHNRSQVPVAIESNPSLHLTAADLQSEQGQYVGAGGAQAVLRFAVQLTSMGKATFLRTGPDFSFADLRDHPAILIGAFSNQWTLRSTRNHRFYFGWEAGGRELIKDRQSPSQAWGLDAAASRKDFTDYSIVSRVLRSETGQPLFVAAGITQYGCTGAAELLTNPSLLREALHNASAPRDWANYNLQMVVATKVVAGIPGPPEVVATHFWK
jgi:hypothetical protein